MAHYQIVIPMSGFGERFRRAGYRMPKPLIPVLGRPIIAYVLDGFPGEADVWFICNREHLGDPRWAMADTLRELCPTGRICSIEPHKLGPVYAVSKIMGELDPALPTVVNYCDFGWRWDWEAFKRFARKTGCDGAVASYTGFHPHMLRCHDYAYSKTEGDRVLAIQEKRPYTGDPMSEWASSGTYYFRTAAIMRHAFGEALRRDDLRLKGEWYVSLAYRPLLEAGLDILVYPLEKFYQWGTPEDLGEFLFHANALKLDAQRQKRPYVGGTTLVPMAGAGQRFAEAGYDLPKPLLPVRGHPMAISAWEDLPGGDANVFALRQGMVGLADIRRELEAKVPGCRLVTLEGLTDGQARTCLAALGGIDPEAPLTIGSCDNGLRYDPDAFMALWNRPDVDAVVWVARGLPGAMRSPKSYGWVDAGDGGLVRGVSVKESLSDPAHDPIITGAFSFRKARYFREAAERMIAREGRVNGEFYVDGCLNDAIALGLRVWAFEVDAYACWGTPDELKTYGYWRDAFLDPKGPFRC